MNDWNGIVSLFIACLELILLVNLLIFAEKNKLNWIIIGIVFLLFGYQAIEFLICGIGLSNSFMTYLGFADITFLPPLNLVFVLTLLRKENKSILFIFIPAVFFILYYAFVVNEFETVKCTVLYASYNYPLGDFYGFFYYTPILIAFLFLINARINLNSVYSISINYLIIAHLILIIPVTIGFSLMIFGSYSLIMSMESILCKFAFFYCLIIAYFALSNKQKQA